MGIDNYSWTGEEEGDISSEKKTGETIEDSGSDEENTPADRGANKSTNWRKL